MATARTDVPTGFGAADGARPLVVTPDGAGRKAQRMPALARLTLLPVIRPMDAFRCLARDAAGSNAAQTARGHE